MAKSTKSKAVSKQSKSAPAAPVAAPITKRVEDGSPYQLDPAQVERAATALIKNMKQHAQEKETKTGKKNLMADAEDDEEESDSSIFLTLATKQHVHESSRLKPSKIALPHPIQNSDVRICLMVADPQRLFKDIIFEDSSFPEELKAKVGRVIGMGKLKKKYKTYETKRQLFAEYDIFLADDRIISDLPKVLGKTFYANTSKRPIPISLAQQLPKDKDGKRLRVVRKPDDIAKQIESALSATYVSLNPTAVTAIKIGKLSQKPEQLSANIQAVVDSLTTKFVPRGWRNIRSIYIKGPTTVALPIWLADELWAEDALVLEEPFKHAPKDASKTTEKKRKWEEWEEEMLDDDELAERKAWLAKSKKSKAATESTDGAEKVSSISKEKRKKMKKEALESVKTPLVAES